MDYNPVKQTKMVFIYIFMIIGLPANFIVLYVSFTGLQNFDFYQTFFWQNECTVLVNILHFDENFELFLAKNVFSRKSGLLTTSLIFDESFYFWQRKFRFLAKSLSFGQSFGQKLFLTKIMIFEVWQTVWFSTKVLILTKILIFDESFDFNKNFDFWRFFGKIGKCVK